MLTASKFKLELNAQIERAMKHGRPHVEINAGELHRKIAHPSQHEEFHAMPLCCTVMRNELQRGNAEIIHETADDATALTIRFKLPR